MRHPNQKPFRIKGSYNPAYETNGLFCQHGIWKRACSECNRIATKIEQIDEPVRASAGLDKRNRKSDNF